MNKVPTALLTLLLVMGKVAWFTSFKLLAIVHCISGIQDNVRYKQTQIHSNDCGNVKSEGTDGLESSVIDTHIRTWALRLL